MSGFHSSSRLHARGRAGVASASLFASALVFLSGGGTGLASAHGLDVVAQRAGAEVTGLARYSDQTPAAHVAVEIFGAQQTPGAAPLVTGMTDAEGRFRLAVDADGQPLRVEVEGEEGHRAETLAANVPSFGVPAAGVTAAAAGPVGDPHPETGPSATRSVSGASDAEAARQMLSLVREDIARLDRQIRFRDILGGIGYLVGVAGMAAWWLARRGR